jgi:hypothetical protein
MIISPRGGKVIHDAYIAVGTPRGGEVTMKS